MPPSEIRSDPNAVSYGVPDDDWLAEKLSPSGPRFAWLIGVVRFSEIFLRVGVGGILVGGLVLANRTGDYYEVIASTTISAAVLELLRHWSRTSAAEDLAVLASYPATVAVVLEVGSSSGGENPPSPVRFAHRTLDGLIQVRKIDVPDIRIRKLKVGEPTVAFVDPTYLSNPRLLETILYDELIP